MKGKYAFFHFVPPPHNTFFLFRPPIMADEPEQVATPEEVEQPTEEVTEDMDLDLIQKADQAAERLEKASKRFDLQLNKLQKLKMESILGGKAQTNIKPVEATDSEYAEKVMANDEEVTKKS